MSQNEERILKQLYDNDTVTFRKLKELTEISPRTLQKRLKELKERKLVLEKGRSNWKQGKSLSYSISEKGKTEYLKMTIANMKNGLDNYFRVFTLFDEQAILLYRESKRQLDPTTKVNSRYASEVELQPDDHYKQQLLKEAFEKFKEAYFMFWGELETFTN